MGKILNLLFIFNSINHERRFNIQKAEIED